MSIYRSQWNNNQYFLGSYSYCKVPLSLAACDVLAEPLPSSEVCFRYISQKLEFFRIEIAVCMSFIQINNYTNKIHSSRVPGSFDIPYCGKWRKILKLYQVHDLDQAMPNVEHFRAVSICSSFKLTDQLFFS